MCRGCRDASRPPRTWPWPAGSGSARSSRRGCCGRSACGRPTRTGPRFVTTSEAPPRRGRELRRRYTSADLRVLTEDEARRFVPGGDGDPPNDIALAGELLYRLRPGAFDPPRGAGAAPPAPLALPPRHRG